VSPPDDFGAAEREEAAYRPGVDRSIGVLFAEIAEDLRRLLRLEVELFQRELGEKTGRLARGVAALAAGGLVAFSGWLVLLAAAVLALSLVLRLWLAALIVGAAVLLVGGVLLWLGKRWVDAQRLVPRRTLNAVREDGAWIKERIL
jgi:Putative Actinobacterial Holin-X, holin superfamily III